MKYKITQIHTDIGEGCVLSKALKLFIGKEYLISELMEMGIDFDFDQEPEEVEYCDEAGCCRLTLKRV